MHLKNNGFTLIELVLSIVIISIALTGTILAFITISRSSGDPMIQQQAINISKSYLEEIMAKAFPAVVPCASPPVGGRAFFNDICDYNNLNETGARDQNNQAISGLESYSIQVNVDTSSASLGGLTAGNEVVRIDVAVSHPQLSSAMVLSGYRTKY